jgi:hypothetical protein
MVMTATGAHAGLVSVAVGLTNKQLLVKKIDKNRDMITMSLLFFTCCYEKKPFLGIMSLRNMRISDEEDFDGEVLRPD